MHTCVYLGMRKCIPLSHTIGVLESDEVWCTIERIFYTALYTYETIIKRNLMLRAITIARLNFVEILLSVSIKSAACALVLRRSGL